MDQHAVAAVLEEVALLMELKGENPFKIRAYQNAVRLLEGLDQDFSELIRTDTLKELKGIGSGLNDQIQTLVKTGSLPLLHELKAEFPETLMELLKIPGLGPKKVKTLYEKLEIKSLGELEYACKENRLVKLDGFGEKTQQKVLAGIEYVRKNAGSWFFASVVDSAEALVSTISAWKIVKRVSIAGSYRRRKEIVKDLDIVCSSTDPEGVMKKFISMDGVSGVIGQGDTKSSVHLKNGLQIDLRVVKDAEFPFALNYFTGSKEHNTEMRSLAKDKGLKLNEYGLFKGDKSLSCKDEEAIYRALDLHYIPPELREGMGEIDRAGREVFPALVEEKDIRGLFHIHSIYSDGRNTLGEMVDAAAKMGLEYVGISDHSQTASYAGGLKESDIDRQFLELDQIQIKTPKVRIFRGIESDILPDGSLDYSAKTLKRFDFVIGSVHAKFNMTEEEMTSRCLKALENPYCTMIGHPTGRLLLARDGFKVNLVQLIDRAAKLGKPVELNANPHRLDLDWRVLKLAKDRSVPVSINPDAHEVEGLKDVRYGVNIARKAGLTKAGVFNTLTTTQMEKALEKIRG